MPSGDGAALTWVARLFLAIGIGAAIAVGTFSFNTLQFISESIEAEGTVVDWVQGQGIAGRSPEPGAYYRVIEIVSPGGQRVRGEAGIGVDMNQLRIGERLTVRYRPDDPTRMRVASIPGLWLPELVSAVIAIAFGAAGAFLLKQAKKEDAQA
jgi:hypothetical protein